MRKELCHFYFGSEISVRLFVDDTGGGHFSLPRHNGTSDHIVVIGLMETSWSWVLQVLLHEMEEMFLDVRGFSYHKDVDWDTGGSDGRTFFFTHPNLSEMNLRIADMLIIVLPKLKKAWREFHKKKKKPRKKKK